MLRIVAPSLVLAVVLGGACAKPATHDAHEPGTGTSGTVDETHAARDTGCATTNTPPATPVVLLPFPNSIVAGDELKIVAAPFVDADRDQHAATLYEIFDGDSRVWSFATRDASKLTTARLGDGTFDRGASLPEWKSLTVKVSFADDSGACNAWSTAGERTFKSDDGSSALFPDTFDAASVQTFSIDLPQSTIDGINGDAVPPGCVQYERVTFPGTFTFGAQVFDDVGVSNKGGCGSARDLNGKASFKVKLTWQDPSAADGSSSCPPSRKLYGQKELTFNNDVQDHTFMHQRMGYRLYRAAGVPAPRDAPALLVVNGAPWGLYDEVESPTRRFLERHFDDATGMMFEGAYACDLVAQNIPSDATDFTSFSCFDREFSAGPCSAPSPDAEDWTLLQQLAASIASVPQGPGWYDGVNAFFDVDEFISMWSVDSVLSHWDAYEFVIVNNYRVYHDPSDGKWRMLPWGIDQTWNGGGDLDPFSAGTVLATGCLSDPACAAKFATRLHEVVDLFEQLDFIAESQQIHDQIVSAVDADPRKEFANDEWEQDVADLQSWIDQRPAQVRQHLADHGFP